MTAPDFTRQAAVAHARLDENDRLLSADAALAETNARAGGAVGLALAVPQLATVVRLARRLAIPVARNVVIADEDTDLELWVQARPDGRGVRLAASGWSERPAWRPLVGGAHAAALASDADWRWESDAALRLTFVNVAAGSRHGFDSIGLLGKPITALFAIGAAADGGIPLIDALASRRSLDAQSARLRPLNKPVELSAAVRRDKAGDFAGFNGSVRMLDATAAPAAPPATRLLDGLDKALRRPLARIVANADSIHARAEGAIAADYADYAADIANAGRHLLGLVDDLVDLEAIDRPDFALAVEPIDLADIARRAAGLLSVRAADAAVTVARPVPEATAPAMGEFRRALQILVNLVTNAVRYAPSGSAVEVDVAATEAATVATVSDRGKGIAPEDQARIFDKFERVDPSEPGGSGLGLYIARRLARAMGGDLSVESAPGRGARFTLTLPPAR